MSKRIRSIPRFIIKLALTVGVLYLCALTVQLVWLRTVAGRIRPEPIVPPYTPSSGVGKMAPRVRRLWPMFPGKRGPSDLHQMTFRGVSVISESWETTAASSEILDYYRSQMAARGWTDVTEAEYGLTPEALVLSAGEGRLQNPKYVESYINVIESNLAMSKGGWSLHVSVEPGKSKWNRVIKISAASTPSIVDFGNELSAAIAGPGTDSGIEVAEETGSGRFDTVVTITEESTRQSFVSKWEQLRAKDWASLFRSGPSGAKSNPSYFAVMKRGDHYGYLTVSPSPGGKGASVVFTKVLESDSR